MNTHTNPWQQLPTVGVESFSAGEPAWLAGSPVVVVKIFRDGRAYVKDETTDKCRECAAEDLTHR